MVGPTIAVIGSPWLRDRNGERRQGDDALAHEKRARAAAEELGRELARAGCRLLVYSAEEHSIEPAVVSGYVSVRKDKRSIEFRHPRGEGGRFPEQDLKESPIHDRVDGEDWVVSFYRSLKDAHGVLLLGGRSMVLIAGHVAMAFERPVAAVAAFEGAAADVWKYLRQVEDLNDDEYDAMGRSWDGGSAEIIVGSLVRRHGVILEREEEERAKDEELENYRREAATRRAARPVLWVTCACFLGVLVIMVIGLSSQTAGRGFLALFVAALTLAGIAGAGLKFLKTPAADEPAKPLLYGAVAGFVFSILYLVPQWAGDQSFLAATGMTWAIRWQILLAPILALTGGLAADSVLESLQKNGESRQPQLPSIPFNTPDEKGPHAQLKKRRAT